MDTIITFGPPILLQNCVAISLFLLTPAFLAALGAYLCQGSALRIVGASIGGAARDILLLIAVTNGWLSRTNPSWTPDFSLILAFFGASAAAIMSCLAPYRGKLLIFNSAIGGLAGQFLLPFIMNPGPANGVQELEREILGELGF